MCFRYSDKDRDISVTIKVFINVCFLVSFMDAFGTLGGGFNTFVSTAVFIACILHRDCRNQSHFHFSTSCDIVVLAEINLCVQQQSF